MHDEVKNIFIKRLGEHTFLGFNQFFYDDRTKAFYCEIKTKGGSIYLATDGNKS